MEYPDRILTRLRIRYLRPGYPLTNAEIRVPKGRGIFYQPKPEDTYGKLYLPDTAKFRLRPDLAFVLGVGSDEAKPGDLAILRPYTGLILDDEEGGFIRCLGVTASLYHGFLGILEGYMKGKVTVKAVGNNFVVEPLPITRAEGKGSPIILPDGVLRNTIHGKVISQGKLIQGDYVGWNVIFSRRWATWIEDIGVFIVPEHDVYGFYRDKEEVQQEGH